MPAQYGTYEVGIRPPHPYPYSPYAPRLSSLCFLPAASHASKNYALTSNEAPCNRATLSSKSRSLGTCFVLDVCFAQFSMPSLDADNDHYAWNPHDQPPQPPVYDPSGTHLINQTRFSDEIPPLPNYSYTPPAVRRPSHSAKPASPSANASADLSHQNENTSDPHDFYRPHLEQDGKASMMHGQDKVLFQRTAALRKNLSLVVVDQLALALETRMVTG